MKLPAYAFLAFLMLCACSHVSTSTTNGHNAWTVPGVLRIGKTSEPDSLNPLFAHTIAADEAQTLLFSYLLRYDNHGNFIPDLATRVPTLANGDISHDGKRITIHLRSGVRWSDGAPLTARDWLFTYSAVRNPLNNVKSQYGWDEIASASAPNDATILIHLKVPDASFLGTLAMGGAAYPPLPAHLLEHLANLNTADFNAHPISSGPFLLKDWQHGSALTFIPNPHYYRGLAHLREILWKVIPNADTLFQNLQNHEIDLYQEVATNQISHLDSISGVRVLTRSVANQRHLGINVARPILRELNVRRAIAIGIDWREIESSIYHDYVDPATSDIFPESPLAPTIPPYVYSRARATQLLDQAGWMMGPDHLRHKDGRVLRLGIISGANLQQNESAEVLMQSMLRQIGISLVIRNYPSSLLFARDGPLYTGHYDIEYSEGSNAPDPDNSGSWNSAFIPPAGGNTSWLRDPIVDATSTAARREFNPVKRKALYQREELRLHELVPAVFVFWYQSHYALNSDFHGFQPAVYISDMWNAWDWSI